MRNYRLIDADSHTLEPKHIWTTYLPKKFHERAPKLVKDADGGDAWLFRPDTPPMTIGLVTTPGRSYDEIKWTGYTYETIRASCFDGRARLADMDIDGVDAEFMYPSQRTMWSFMADPDPEYHLAGVQAYNNWVHDEFCAADRERLFALCQMPNIGVDAAIAEMKRGKDKGMCGVIISAWPGGEDDLCAADDKFFAAAEEMDLPIAIHVNIRRKRAPVVGLDGPAAIARMALAGMMQFPPSMCDLIMSGVFDRFPKLTVLGVEVDVGWIPVALEQLDNFYWRNRAHTGVTIKRLPSEYFHEHFICTFLTDRHGIANRYEIGVRNMAWSTDFPHHGNDWPYSRKVAGEMFQGVPKEEVDLICAGNMIRAFKLPHDPSAARGAR